MMSFPASLRRFSAKALTHGSRTALNKTKLCAQPTLHAKVFGCSAFTSRRFQSSGPQDLPKSSPLFIRKEDDEQKDSDHQNNTVTVSEYMNSLVASIGLPVGVMGYTVTEAADTGNAAAGTAAAAAAAAASGAAAMPAALVTFLKVAPIPCFFFLQISGLKTVKDIKANGSVGDLSILPFLSLSTNCIIWSLYGHMVDDPTVLLPNVSGAIFGTYYTAIYMKYSGIQVVPLATAGTILATVATIAATQPVDVAAQNIGYIGCALAVILMASPLATMATVIKTKSTESLPFATSLGTLLNASAWASYGYLVADNPLIYGPNLLGFAAAMVQMSLFARFGIHQAKK